MGFDDGICIFWNTKTLEAREPPDAFVYAWALMTYDSQDDSKLRT